LAHDLLVILVETLVLAMETLQDILVLAACQDGPPQIPLFGAIPGRVFLTGSIYGPNFQSQAGLPHFTCPEFLAVCRFFCPLKLRSQQLGQTCFASVLSQIVFPNGVKPQ
jgi:hypothetical protein